MASEQHVFIFANRMTACVVLVPTRTCVEVFGIAPVYVRLHGRCFRDLWLDIHMYIRTSVHTYGRMCVLTNLYARIRACARGYVHKRESAHLRRNVRVSCVCA